MDKIININGIKPLNKKPTTSTHDQILHYLYNISNEDCRIRAIQNFIFRRTTTISPNRVISNVAQAIMYGFHWDAQPEIDTYWDYVYNNGPLSYLDYCRIEGVDPVRIWGVDVSDLSAEDIELHNRLRDMVEL